MQKIVIIDYGLGNLGSIQNMIKKAGGTSKTTNNPSEILSATKLLLPGVGSFDAGMQKLINLELISTLNESVIKNKIPILGICLGAQLMTKASEEGSIKGLGWLDAKTARFQIKTGNTFKVPHMGWNRIRVKQSHRIFKDTQESSRFYFVHSYHFTPNDDSICLCTTDYAYPFSSGLVKDNIIALQFHPEKSHNFGLQLFKQYLAL
tara:strand:+ start:607 stop:1224 length:618 start_codon:yes stop_codon:yes gene_type:complete